MSETTNSATRSNARAWLISRMVNSTTSPSVVVPLTSKRSDGRLVGSGGCFARQSHQARATISRASIRADNAHVDHEYMTACELASWLRGIERRCTNTGLATLSRAADSVDASYFRGPPWPHGSRDPRRLTCLPRSPAADVSGSLTPGNPRAIPRWDLYQSALWISAVRGV